MHINVQRDYMVQQAYAVSLAASKAEAAAQRLHDFEGALREGTGILNGTSIELALAEGRLERALDSVRHARSLLPFAFATLPEAAE